MKTYKILLVGLLLFFGSVLQAQIPVGASFELTSPVPIDHRDTTETLSSLYAYPSTWRYEGLMTYVSEDSTLYQLRGGITNSDWFEIGTGSSTDEKETANRLIYVSLYTGNDTTGDGSVSNKFRTLDRGLQDVKYNLGTYTITIKLDTGHYTVNNYYRFHPQQDGMLKIQGLSETYVSGLTFTQVTDDPHCYKINKTLGSNDAREYFIATNPLISQIPIYKNNLDTVWASDANVGAQTYIAKINTFIDDFIQQKIDYDGSGVRRAILYNNLHVNYAATYSTIAYISTSTGTESNFTFCNLDNGTNSAMYFYPTGSQYFNLSRVITNNSAHKLQIEKTTNDRFWWGLSVIDNHTTAYNCFHAKSNNMTLSGGAFLNANSVFDDADGNFASFFFNKGYNYWFDNITTLFEISNSVLYWFDNDVGSQIEFTLSDVDYLVQHEDVGVTPTNIQLRIDADKIGNFKQGITSTIDNLIDIDNNVRINWAGVTTDTTNFLSHVKFSTSIDLSTVNNSSGTLNINAMDLYLNSGITQTRFESGTITFNNLNNSIVFNVQDEDGTSGFNYTGSSNLLSTKNIKTYGYTSLNEAGSSSNYLKWESDNEQYALYGDAANDEITIETPLKLRENSLNYHISLTKSTYIDPGIANHTLYTLPIPNDAVVQLQVKTIYLNESAGLQAVGTYITDFSEGSAINNNGTITLLGMGNDGTTRGSFAGGNPLVSVSGSNLLIQWQQTADDLDAGTCTVFIDALILDGDF